MSPRMQVRKKNLRTQVFNWSLPPIQIVLITLLNDAATLVISVDNASISPRPDKWRLGQLLFLSFTYAMFLMARRPALEPSPIFSAARCFFARAPATSGRIPTLPFPLPGRPRALRICWWRIACLASPCPALTS